MPIMYDNLISICKKLDQVCISNYELRLFRAAYSLAFFGFFRVSEMVFAFPLQPDPPLHTAGLQFQARAVQQFLQICLRKSK